MSAKGGEASVAWMQRSGIQDALRIVNRESEGREPHLRKRLDSTKNIPNRSCIVCFREAKSLCLKAAMGTLLSFNVAALTAASPR